MLTTCVEFLSISKGVTRPNTVDNSIIACNRNIDSLPPKELSMHAHNYFNLMYIIDAKDCSAWLNECEIQFQEKHIYLQPPNTLHMPTHQYTGTMTTISIRFNVCDRNLTEQIGSVPSMILCNDIIEKLILEVGNFEGKSFKQSYLNEQTAKILDEFLKAPNRKIISRDKDKVCDTPSFTRIIRYMYAHYDEKIALSDMAKVMHMESTYFAKKFKSTYNITPMNYLYSVRLFRSLDMLMYSNISIASIAEKVGFKNVAAFCTAFRRAYNLSPGDYRKEAQKRKFDVVE